MSVLVEYLEGVPAEGGRREIMAGEKFDVTTLARAKHFHPGAVVRTVRGARYIGPGSLVAFVETGETLGMIELEGEDLAELELLVAAEAELAPDPVIVAAEVEAGSGPGDVSGGGGGEAGSGAGSDGADNAQDGAGAAEGGETAPDTSAKPAARSGGSKKAKDANVGSSTG